MDYCYFFKDFLLEIKVFSCLLISLNSFDLGSKAILLQNVLHGILEMIITCFTYMQFFINWFHCMIQICNENVMLFMLKQFNNPLIQASMVYSSNIIVIPALFYLQKVILNITTFFFCFLGTSFFDILFVFLVFPGTLRLDILFDFLNFLGTLLFHLLVPWYFTLLLYFHFNSIFYLPASSHSLPDTLLSDM